MLLISILFSACGKHTANTEQVNSTLQHMSCYKDLVEEISTNQEISRKIVQLRESKKRGTSDPVTVKQEYRTIEKRELENLLSSKWTKECLGKLQQENDFKGIRYISQDEIIIEVDQFRLRKPDEYYSKRRVIEIHRLLITDSKLNGDLYKFGNEHVVWSTNFGEKWTYEVSQYETVY